jgi:hypothetical protein
MALRLRHAIPLICLFGFVAVTQVLLDDTSRANSMHSFRLVILRQEWSDLSLGYSLDTATAKLNAADRSDPLISIDSNDIDAYDWNGQNIVLAPSASAKFQLLAVGAKPGVSLSRAIDMHGFVAVFDDAPVYGGVVLGVMSQMPVRYPVLRVEMQGDRALLHVLPTQIPMAQTDVPAERTRWAAAISADVKDWSRLPEKTQESILSAAFTPAATAVRRLIRNESARLFLDAEGKLKVPAFQRVAGPVGTTATH